MESSLLTHKKSVSKDDTKKMLRKEHATSPRIGTSMSEFESKKLSIVGTKSNIHDFNLEPCSHSDEEGKGEIVGIIRKFTDLKAQVSKLPYEVEVEVLANVPCFQYWKLNFLNKQFSHFFKSGEIFRVRREQGLEKPFVFILTTGESCWIICGKSFENFRKLPPVPSNFCFLYGYNETISAGTQLIVIRNEVEGMVVWIYEFEMHKWAKGPSIITPRVLYGSASRGNDAFFARGIQIENRIPEVVKLVEKYNDDTKTWTTIHEMHKKRKFSSGCFLRGKFYVIGGRDENRKYLTCGESYDEVENSWTLIPDILKDVSFKDPKSPPLIAVVNDNLYLLETTSNELLVYDLNKNDWKKLGTVPVNANAYVGWGFAFKSIGDRILVIGASIARPYVKKMAVYTCCPSPDVEEQVWEETKNCCDGVELTSFILNWCVMFA